MTRLIAVSLCLLATPALAQVQVSARTEKSSFLAGEPIFVVVDIKNVGDEPIGYNGGTIGRPPLTFVVANGTPKPVVSLSACGSPVSGPAIGMVDHPPLLKPGAQISRRYLVRGYRLTPGSYELRVAGHADVRWKYYPTLGNGLAAPPPKHQDSDPVEGALVDQTLPLVIVAGTEAEREAAFKPYVANAMEIYRESGLQSAQWCDGNPAAEMQARWRRFWASNGSTMKIYPADKCVELAGLPFIK